MATDPSLSTANPLPELEITATREHQSATMRKHIAPSNLEPIKMTAHAEEKCTPTTPSDTQKEKTEQMTAHFWFMTP
jgi:hypothetical protein